jgi:DNA polymerase-3 subunit alpha
MQAGGYSDEAISTLWEVLVPFSDYAFNKAHSAAYGMIS